jgi:phosphate transport system permease protein
MTRPAATNAGLFVPRLERRLRLARAFYVFSFLISVSAAAVLIVLFTTVWKQGASLLSWEFLSRMPSNLDPEAGGIKSALAGTIWLMGLTALISVPTGIGTAIYLQEYAGRSRFSRLIQINIANLAGVPSIVYGILGLAVFVRYLSLDRSVIAGALTMSLLILPTIVIASREALAAVPRTVREAAYALGATRWQMVRHHVLPEALPGILTGIILSMSRAIGETAPLIMIGALTYVAFVPGGDLSDYDPTVSGCVEWLDTAVHDQFTAMPIQIYDWASRPQKEFHTLAAAAIIMLLGVLLAMNGIAIAIRAWWQKGRT